MESYQFNLLTFLLGHQRLAEVGSLPSRPLLELCKKACFKKKENER